MPEDAQAHGIGTTIVIGGGGANAQTPRFEGEQLAGDAFVARRGDHLGLTLAGRMEVLAVRLPQGSDLWCGLFTEMPDRLGLGGTQLAIDRLAVSRWATVQLGARARRTNAQSIIWPSPGLTAAAVAIGWGLWSAETDGTLQAFDFLRSDDGAQRSFALSIGSRPAFSSGEIGLVL